MAPIELSRVHSATGDCRNTSAWMDRMNDTVATAVGLAQASNRIAIASGASREIAAAPIRTAELTSPPPDVLPAYLG